jgi:RHS repeat-associated protein
MYTYDVYGQRIAKSIDADGAGSAPVQTERMVYDGSNIALTFDGTGTQTHRYLHGPGVDQILADETQTSVNWALVDNQGTVRDVIDSQGQVLNHIVYDSYGQVTSETNPRVEFRYGYTGRERDEETGLNYYRARYYDTTTGGFLSEDPLGFAADDYNLSRYVFGSPTNGTDPSGMNVLALGLGQAILLAGATIIVGGYVIQKLKEVSELKYPQRFVPGTWTGEQQETKMSTSTKAPPTPTSSPSPLPLPLILNDPNCQNAKKKKCPKILPVFEISRTRYDWHAQTVTAAFATGDPSILTKSSDNTALVNKRRRDAQAPYRHAWGAPSQYKINGLPVNYDEYPYASTEEGGLGAYVKMIPEKANKSAGTALKTFYAHSGEGGTRLEDGCKFMVIITP